MTTIAISQENWKALGKLGNKGDTFDDIISRLLKGNEEIINIFSSNLFMDKNNLGSTEHLFHNQLYDAMKQHSIEPYIALHEAVLLRIGNKFHPEKEFRAWELGCGDGELTLKLLKAFPSAKIIATDISEELVEKALERVKDYGNRVKLETGDFSQDMPTGRFDVIMSALAIHHLNREDYLGPNREPPLINRIYKKLNSNGLYVNADCVNNEAENPEFNYLQGIGGMISRYFNAPGNMFTFNQVMSKVVSIAQRQLKEPYIPIQDIKEVMRNIGFNNIKTDFAFHNYAVYSAEK